MLTFIFIILLFISLYFCYDFKNKITNQKTQILLLKQQNGTLKSKIFNDKSNLDNLTVKFELSESPHVFGTINQKCTLYLAPLESSIVLSKISIGSSARILCTAKSLNKSWYEVYLESPENTNNKGWVLESCINVNINMNTDIEENEESDSNMDVNMDSNTYDENDS